MHAIIGSQGILDCHSSWCYTKKKQHKIVKLNYLFIRLLLQVDSFIDIQSNIFKKTFSISNLVKIWKYGKGHFLDYIRVVFRNEENQYISMTDRIFALYIQLMDLDTIVPVVSKVHNNGWDALGNSFKGKEFSGELLKSQKMYSEHREDIDLHFNYKGNSHEYEKFNNDLAISIGNSYESLLRL